MINIAVSILAMIFIFSGKVGFVALGIGLIAYVIRDIVSGHYQTYLDSNMTPHEIQKDKENVKFMLLPFKIGIVVVIIIIIIALMQKFS